MTEHEPPDQPPIVPLDDIRQQVKQWRTAQHRLRHWKAVAAEAQRTILAHMRADGGTVGTVNGRRAVVVHHDRRRRVDIPDMRAEAPELVDKHTKIHDIYSLRLPDKLDGAA